MQVFKIEPTISYSYGIALVAARNSEEAINTYCATEFRNEGYIDLRCKCNIVVGLDYKINSPAVIFDKISLG